MARLLLVEDETRIADVVRDYLANAGHEAVIAATGQRAIDEAKRTSFDLVVLDLGLPDMDGLDVARELRRRSEVPIVILTARDDELDRILGLEFGADDYVTKPFSPRELVARIKAVLRRGAIGNVTTTDDGEVDRVLDVEVDRSRRRVTVAGRDTDLTATEFELVAVMAASPGRVFSRSQLLDAVHGVSFETYERAIDAHVKNIRKKLEPVPSEPRYLLTVHGVGYRFTDQ